MRAEGIADILRGIGLDSVVIRNQSVMACCPNHDERRPSWGVSIAAPYLHGCFACGYKGSLRNLLLSKGMNTSQVDTLIGHESTATVAGMTFQPDREDTEVVFHPRVLYPFLANHGKVIQYMRRRGFSDFTVSHYRLKYDAENDRVVIPWYAPSLVGATGRAIDPDVQEKMLAYGFSKGRFLWMPDGKLNHRKPLVLVEGEFDAMALQRVGVKNVAALGQGKFTKFQIRALENLPVNHLILFMDNDEHGTEIADTIRSKMKRVCKVTKVTNPYPYNDPAEFMASKAHSELQEVVKSALVAPSQAISFT